MIWIILALVSLEKGRGRATCWFECIFTTTAVQGQMTVTISQGSVLVLVQECGGGGGDSD